MAPPAPPPPAPPATSRVPAIILRSGLMPLRFSVPPAVTLNAAPTASNVTWLAVKLSPSAMLTVNVPVASIRATAAVVSGGPPAGVQSVAVAQSPDTPVVPVYVVIGFPPGFWRRLPGRTARHSVRSEVTAPWLTAHHSPRPYAEQLPPG